jgi:hypothetical protein
LPSMVATPPCTCTLKSLADLDFANFARITVPVAGPSFSAPPRLGGHRGFAGAARGGARGALFGPGRGGAHRQAAPPKPHGYV